MIVDKCKAHLKQSNFTCVDSIVLAHLHSESTKVRHKWISTILTDLGSFISHIELSLKINRDWINMKNC